MILRIFLKLCLITFLVILKLVLVLPTYFTYITYHNFRDFMHMSINRKLIPPHFPRLSLHKIKILQWLVFGSVRDFLKTMLNTIHDGIEATIDSIGNFSEPLIR